jgi:hypothetical protein
VVKPEDVGLSLDIPEQAAEWQQHVAELQEQKRREEEDGKGDGRGLGTWEPDSQEYNLNAWGRNAWHDDDDDDTTPVPRKERTRELDAHFERGKKGTFRP